MDVHLDDARVRGDREVSAAADRRAARSPPAPPCGRVSAAVASTAATSSSQSSASLEAAGRTRAAARRAARPRARCGPDRAPSRPPPAPAASACGVRARRQLRRGCGSASARREGVELEERLDAFGGRPRAGSPAAGGSRSGCRRGPGTGCRRGSSSAPVCQRRPAALSARRSGSTLPTGAASPWSNTRASRARSSGSRSRFVLGDHVGGQPALLHRYQWMSSWAGTTMRRIDPQAVRPAGRRSGRRPGRWRRRRRRRHSARHRGRRAAPGRARPARRRPASGTAAPSAAVARQDRACPGRIAAPPPAPTAATSRRSSRPAKARLVGPSASVFHSGASWSVAATKVGSPPKVSRTSPAASARSTRSPAARMSCHCRSVYGLVTRGVSRMRVTVMAKSKVDSALLDEPGDRRGRLRVGAGGERDVPLARHQARGRVEADPAGAGQVDLGPGMQVGEVLGRPCRPVQRLHVGDELDQVAGHEPRGVAEMAQRLHQQPGRIAAASLALRRASARASTRPAPGARCRTPAPAPCRFSRDQHVHGALLAARHLGQQGVEQRAGRVGAEERRQLEIEDAVVGERPGLGLGLQEEVERVDGGEVGDRDPPSRRNASTFSGNTTRARKLPCGSCCQFRKCGFGSIVSA